MGPVQWDLFYESLSLHHVLCTTRQLPRGILWLSITFKWHLQCRGQRVCQWVGAGGASSPTSSDHRSHFKRLLLNWVCGKMKMKKKKPTKNRGRGAFCEDGNQCSVRMRQSRSFRGKSPNIMRCLIDFGNRRVSAQGRLFYLFVCYCGGARGSWSVGPGPGFRPWRLFTLVHDCRFAA